MMSRPSSGVAKFSVKGPDDPRSPFTSCSGGRDRSTGQDPPTRQPLEHIAAEHFLHLRDPSVRFETAAV